MSYCSAPSFVFRRVLAPLAALGLALACGPDGSPDAATDGSSGGTGDSTGTPPSATTMPSTTTTPSADGTSTGGPIPSDETTADASATSDHATEGDGFIPRPDGGGPGDGLPLGEQCESDRDCASEHCFEFGFGFSVCSECGLDSECMQDGGPGTCSFGAMAWAACTDGSAGTMCQSSEGCAGDLVCAVVFEGSPLQLCSECAATAECDEGSVCVGSVGGNICAAPGTIENGEFCPQDGGLYCMSTHCTQVEDSGTPTGLWLCGECTVDDDCDEGQVCMPAFIGSGTIGPSMCG